MTVCLVMICKNESRCIARALESAKPMIDRWCVVDTGSTDGTQQIVRDCMGGIAGTLHERSWVDQQHNRNESFDLAKLEGCDYLLQLDADERFCFPKGAPPRGSLTADCYDFTVLLGSIEFARTTLLSTRFRWRWHGARHPKLIGDGAQQPIALQPTAYVVPSSDGASWSEPDKYVRHCAELEQDLRHDPDNPRKRYYLAQSYRDAGFLQSALRAYERRAEMEGWAEERWSAAHEAAKLKERLEYPIAQIGAAYLSAYHLRPTRAEPVYRLAKCFRAHGLHRSALEWARVAAVIEKPPDRLFVEWGVYLWGALYELGMAAYECDELEEAQRVIAELERRRPAINRMRAIAGQPPLVDADDMT